jgi:hypothetical protein
MNYKSQPKEIMMGKMIAYCGIDCGKCEAFIAKKENNNEIRKKYAKELSERFDVEVLPETVNCDGCPSSGEHMGYCSKCGIRDCCNDKGIENCAFCDDYVCEKLEKVYTFMRDVIGKIRDNEAEAKVTLDEIRKNI